MESVRIYLSNLTKLQQTPKKSRDVSYTYEYSQPDLQISFREGCCILILFLCVRSCIWIQRDTSITIHLKNICTTLFLPFSAYAYRS